MSAAHNAIMIHGFLDAGAIWRPLKTCLGTEAEGWLTPDLAGMSKLYGDDGPHTLERYAADIGRLIDQTAGPLVLVAHSMGTQIAELAALARPSRVQALAFVSPVPLGGVHAPAEVAQRLAATGGDVAAMRETRCGLMAAPVDPIILDWLVGLGRDVRRSVTEELVAAWNEGVPEGRAQSPFQGPVLVASGDLDSFVTPEMATDVARRFAHGRQVSVKGAGHWPHAEQPEQVGQLIADFLAQIPQATTSAKAEVGRTRVSAAR